MAGQHMKRKVYVVCQFGVDRLAVHEGVEDGPPSGFYCFCAERSCLLSLGCESQNLTSDGLGFRV